MPALMSTSLPDLPPPKVGKVREVYDLGDRLAIVATDRISAFDVVMANGIPDKGRVLTRMSAFWFERLADVCPNHVVSVDDRELSGLIPGWTPDLAGRTTLARKCRPLPVECVARGYICGSLLKAYQTEGPEVCGISLPPGMVESDRLPEPIFTPATKAETGHDENISFAQMVDIVGRDTAERLREWTLRLYALAARYAATRGILLADTKFEFGETDDGLVWIDEALTPDSSRFWPADAYQPGRSQPSYDKQFVRDYLESIGWDKNPPGPALPDDVVERTRAKYVEALERITGRGLSTF
ncbi:MAG: phosphoribosylaminoimidazolesuccinocarboxamide synthase [Fimbriimonadaceae bacterium]